VKEKVLIYDLALLMMLVTAYAEEGVIADEYQVTDVIDGDTIDVWMNGKETRVRLLGVDTPETVRPGSPVECFGKEASNYTESMLLGEIVYLETDSSQAEYDRYGRLLAYVYLEGSNVSFNQMLLAEGYANMYKNNVPIKYEADFAESERLAREYNKGLWGANCEIL
jgi:micrococcal nuclease